MYKVLGEPVRAKSNLQKKFVTTKTTIVTGKSMRAFPALVTPAEPSQKVWESAKRGQKHVRLVLGVLAKTKSFHSPKLVTKKTMIVMARSITERVKNPIQSHNRSPNQNLSSTRLSQCQNLSLLSNRLLRWIVMRMVVQAERSA